MRFSIRCRPEIGDTLSLRPLIKKLKERGTHVVVSEDNNGLLGDLGVTVSPFCPYCGCHEIKGEEFVYRICMMCGSFYQWKPHVYVPEASHESPGHLMSETDRCVNSALGEWLYASTKAESVLDVGCKYPYLLSCLALHGVETLGIDIIPRVIEYGNMLNVPVIHGDFLSVPVQRKVSLVTMVHVLEHFTWPVVAVQRAKLWLDSGGWLYVRCPDASLDVSKELNPSYFDIHPTIPASKALRLLLEREGFEIEREDKIGTSQTGILARLVKKEAQKPCMSMYTRDSLMGDYIRRHFHFYSVPFYYAREAGLDISVDSISHLDLPPLPETDSFSESVLLIYETGCGGVGSARSWPVDRWIRLAYELKRTGRTVAFVGIKPLEIPAIKVYSGMPLLEVMASITHEHIVVSADTGLAHVAIARGAKTVVLCGPADPVLTYPYSAPNVRFVECKRKCLHCYNYVKDGKPYVEGEQMPIHTCGTYPNVDCMQDISLNKVMGVVEQWV